MFEVGRTIAMDFEGVKLEVAVKSLECMDLGHHDDSAPESTLVAGAMGQLLAPTEISFSKLNTSSKLVSLIGDNVAGGGQANNIFLKDFDFEKLDIGGLNQEFNEIFRRAFASRIWPEKVVQQLGIHHVRGMLL